MLRILLISVLLTATIASSQNDAGTMKANPPESANATPTSQNNDHDPLLDLPPLPKGKVSLIGGTILKLDRVQDRFTLQPFGGKQKMKLIFDVRTRFYRDGEPARQRDIKQGERVYVDTMLDGTKIFAKSIWIDTGTSAGSGRGQIMSFEPATGELKLRDELSAEPARFKVGPNTLIRRGGQAGSVSDLKPGALVSIAFGPSQGRQESIREISVLAQPGSQFSFVGRVTFVDLSRRVIAIANDSDNATYEIQLEALPSGSFRNLREGAQASIAAVFDGQRYIARSLEVRPSDQTPAQQ